MGSENLYDHYGRKVAIDVAHAMVHAGKMYSMGYFWSEYVSTDTPIADNACAVLIIKPAKEIHITQHIAVGGDCEVYNYLGVTTGTTEAGTSISGYQHNQESAKVSACQGIYGSSGILASITPSTSLIQLPGLFMPGGTGGNRSGIAGPAFDQEFNLEAGQVGATLIRNRSGGQIPVSILNTYYEPHGDTSTSS